MRAFIAGAYDADMHAKKAQSKDGYIDKEGQVRWLKRLDDKGWIAPAYAAPVAPTYFNDRKTSIYAGSNEIQHNLMAKMILGA